MVDFDAADSFSVSKLLHIPLYKVLHSLLAVRHPPMHVLGMNITMHGRIYQLVKRGPRRYQSVETRETAWISLHTDSKTVAKPKAPMAWSEMIKA